MTTRNVSDLRPHPKNEEIYGDHSRQHLAPDFVQSIKDLGVLVPVLVSFDNRVISGHRRWTGASAAGLAEVPVVVFPSKDEDEILQALIHANKQREKDNEQLAREAAELFAIEGRLAAKRRNESLKMGSEVPVSLKSNEREIPEENGDLSEKGRTDKKVAKALGIGANKAVEAKIVIETIETLKKEGKEEKAEEIRNILNKKSVHAAYVEATKPEPVAEDEEVEQQEEEKHPLDCVGVPLPPKAIPAFEKLPEIRSLCHDIDSVIKRLEEIGKSDTGIGFHMHWQSAQTQLRGARKTVWQGKPSHVCPYCKGKKKDCRTCKGFGFVSAWIYDQAPKETKETA